MSEPIGVLLMSYGTPGSAADIEAYYTHIRRGRPPSKQQLTELEARYAAIGGSSPLLEICSAQAAGLQRMLGEEAASRFHVELGMKHSQPFIEDAVERLVQLGVREAVALVLAPHYSRLSVGEYISRARDATAGRIDLRFVSDWHLMPAYISLLAARVREAMQSLRAISEGEVEVVFTAHSLPTRILKMGDPYPQQLRESAAAAAGAAGLARFMTAWQSAGRTSEEWLRPDIRQVICTLAARRCKGVIVCPAGFTSDHLEVLYDLDVECASLAAELGLMWRRTRSLNADPALLSGLARLVCEHVDGSGVVRTVAL